MKLPRSKRTRAACYMGRPGDSYRRSAVRPSAGSTGVSRPSSPVAVGASAPAHFPRSAPSPATVRLARRKWVRGRGGWGVRLPPVSRPPRLSAARANEDFFGRDRLGGFAERRSTRPGRGDDGRPSSRAFSGHEVSGCHPPRSREGLSGASEAFSSDPS